MFWLQRGAGVVRSHECHNRRAVEGEYMFVHAQLNISASHFDEYVSLKIVVVQATVSKFVKYSRAYREIRIGGKRLRKHQIIEDQNKSVTQNHAQIHMYIKRYEYMW